MLKTNDKQKSNTKLNPKKQKEALKKILAKKFKDVEFEKSFDWLQAKSDKLESIRKVLENYRGFDFYNEKHRPNCDFVIEDKKIIIEYDEKQHFSQARKIALEAYPDIELGFDKQKWIELCKQIQARDNDPVDRDERRAFYDSTRDILSARNGYKLIRIYYKDYDFSNENDVLQIMEVINEKSNVR